MINLIDIANKLNVLLNGLDPNLPPSTMDKRPNYEFLVQATGVHLDTIANRKTGKNYIPVFIDSNGGSIKPIPNLLETTFTSSLTFYYPMTEKEEFFNLADYLADIFVGRVVDFGGHTGKGVCNISPAQYGEIQDVDLQKFFKWTQCTYNLEINETVPYMSCTINLYISTANLIGKINGPFYGNDIKIELSYDLEGIQVREQYPTFIQTAISTNSGESSEQILGDIVVKGLPNTTAYSVPFNLVVKDSDFYRILIQKYFFDFKSPTQGHTNISDVIMKVKITIPFLKEKATFEKTFYVVNAGLNIAKGELLTFSFNLAERKEL